MEPIKLAVMNLNEAKTFKSQLEKQGIELILGHNESTCTRGCTVTVEILAYEKDVEAVINEYNKNYMKLLDGHKIDFEAINSFKFDNSMC